MEEVKEEIIENTAEDEYVSVAKFAEMAGISKQAVYQRLNKDLSTYSKVDGKGKLISTAALSLFTVKLNDKEQSIESPVEQTVEQVDVKVEQENLNLIDYLKAENERLKRQVDEKEEIIARKDELIIGYASKFAALAERAQELTNNAQHLHAISVLEPPKNDEENKSEPEVTVEKKKLFFGIFRRKQK